MIVVELRSPRRTLTQIIQNRRSLASRVRMKVENIFVSALSQKVVDNINILTPLLFVFNNI